MTDSFAQRKVFAPERPQLPRAMIFWVSITCALMTTLALQILLSHRGIQITESFRDATDGGTLRFRSALAWWVLAGSALIVAAAVAGLLRRYPPPWRRLRALRWLLGAAITFGLAAIAHMAETPEGVSAGIQVFAIIAAMAIAVVLAMLGTLVTLRR